MRRISEAAAFLWMLGVFYFFYRLQGHAELLLSLLGSGP
jgi:hypothetical protein